MTEYKYLVENPDFPYCAGCGHTMINKALDQALQKTELPPSKINLVSDIGCVGLVDKLFLTNTIHTTHGRSTAFATGLELADKILFDGDAVHVIMIGDGGATIGLSHLIEAAKMNVNITVLLHNNFVYGMTGGQNSGLTPENFRTATTMAGSLVPNIHIAKLLEAAHASYISRKLATDKDLDQAIYDAIKHPGFALVEVVELCTGYATKWNSLAKKDIEEILEKTDSGKRGLVHKIEREDFSKLYKKTYQRQARPENLQMQGLRSEAICDAEDANVISNESEKSQNTDLELNIIMCGSAGEGIQFASRLLINSALEQGLNVSQKNDNPVTIGTGFSLSEIKISSKEILYSGIDKADYILISSEDGLKRVQEYFQYCDENTIILCDSSLEEVMTKRNVIPNEGEESQSSCTSHPGMISYHPFRKNAPDARNINIMMLSELYKIEKNLDLISLKKCIESIKKNEKILACFA